MMSFLSKMIISIQFWSTQYIRCNIAILNPFSRFKFPIPSRVDVQDLQNRHYRLPLLLTLKGFPSNQTQECYTAFELFVTSPQRQLMENDRQQMFENRICPKFGFYGTPKKNANLDRLC